MLALYRSRTSGGGARQLSSGARDPGRGARHRSRPAAPALEQAILTQDPSLDAPRRLGSEPLERPRVPTRGPRRHDGGSVRRPCSIWARRSSGKPVYELIVARLVRPEAELVGRDRAHARGARRPAIAGHRVEPRRSFPTSPGEDVVRLASDRDVALALLEAPARAPGGRRSPTRTWRVVPGRGPCDVALLVLKERSPDGPVVVPFGGAGPRLGRGRARRVGRERSGRTAAARRGRGRPRRAESGTRAACCSTRRSQCSGPWAWPPNRSWPHPGVEGMLRRASADASLLVVGLSDRWQREGLGPVRLALAQETPSPRHCSSGQGCVPGGLAPHEPLTQVHLVGWTDRA